MFTWLRRKRHQNIKVIRHHTDADMFLDGRYLVVNMSTSLESVRGRELAREIANRIMETVALHQPPQEIIGQERRPHLVNSQPEN